MISLYSFLGIANYFQRYVQGYAHVANPLTESTKKGVTFQWGPYQRKAFAQLKNALCSAPILQYPDPSLPHVCGKSGSGQLGLPWELDWQAQYWYQ